jgi:prolyl oligopeptidase
VGIFDTPDGRAFYRELIAYHTTTQLSADEIHAIGLREVARIRTEMDKIIASVGFKGDFAAFIHYLRTDPRFFYTDPDELLHGYMVIAKSIDPNLVKLFGKLPRTPYGVRPVPATSAPNTTTAYYQPLASDGSRPGFYYVNLYKPDQRPKWEMEVLTTHEAVPGHHLQIALQYENAAGVPMIRRMSDFTAYAEGWGLYAESLGGQLGLYTDPYSKFGELTYDMWRAVRLVVDTGIHDRGWTRQRAIDFFMANAPKSELDITNEIDRYIAWPGQALAYKVGQLKIMELRDAAQRTLGDKFDIRAFHDTVLSTGAVPLSVLENTVRQWVASQQ